MRESKGRFINQLAFGGAANESWFRRLAWVLWRTAYMTKSVSWRNRILIPVLW